MKAMAFLLLSALSFSSMASPNPDEMVGQVVKEVLLALSSDQRITREPYELDRMVRRKVLPHFEVRTMARLIVGKDRWRDSSPQLKDDLSDAFRTFLGHAISGALSGYDGEKVNILSSSVGEGRALVRTEILGDGRTELDYDIFYAHGAWMIYDVELDGLSIVKLYRLDFSRALLLGGASGLLDALQAKNREVEKGWGDQVSDSRHAFSNSSTGTGLPK